MSEDNKQRHSFWGSLPGLLTGIAAVITALTGLYIAFEIDKKQSGGGNPPPLPPDPPPSPLPSEFTKNWPVLGEETFSSNQNDWMIGTEQYPNMIRAERSITGGKYRLDLKFRDKYEIYSNAPFGPGIDIYFSADVRFVDYNNRVAAKLLFGQVSNSDYGFSIRTDKKFALTRYENSKEIVVLDWTPLPIDFNPTQTNRMSVVVEKFKIMLYLNDNLLGSYRNEKYSGGKVGISVQAFDPQTTAVVDFDNLEYKRKG